MIAKPTGTIAIMTALCLGGCSGTPQSQYYLLGAASAEAASENPSVGGPLLFVDPVTVASYADRSQMVTRWADGRVTFAEFEVWAQPIGSQITAALVDELGRRFGADRVLTTPLRVDFDAEYRLSVDVLRVDASEAGEAVLDARWTLLGGADEHFLTTRREHLAERIADPASYSQRVAALNGALRRLTERIAAVIISSKPAGR